MDQSSYIADLLQPLNHYYKVNNFDILTEKVLQNNKYFNDQEQVEAHFVPFLGLEELKSKMHG